MPPEQRRQSRRLHLLRNSPLPIDDSREPLHTPHRKRKPEGSPRPLPEAQPEVKASHVPERGRYSLSYPHTDRGQVPPKVDL